jgi:hypothetical protein
MAITTQTFVLPYGAKLVFHYDDSYPQEQQVGTLDYYQAIINQLVYQSLEYYNQPDGTNKFLNHVTLHIWADQIPYDKSPDNLPYEQTFWTFNDDNGNSHIYAHWLDPNQGNGYRFPASISHEFGHAYHNWAGWPADMRANPTGWGAEIHRVWKNAVIGTGVFPQGWNEYEAWANAYRCLKGVQTTRGISGPTLNGGSDPVPAQMQDPLNHPEWLKWFNLIPELCGFGGTFGIKTGTLQWCGDQNGYWLFQNSLGQWHAQTDYDTWFYWTGANWVQYSPIYKRP